MFRFVEFCHLLSINNLNASSFCENKLVKGKVFTGEGSSLKTLKLFLQFIVFASNSREKIMLSIMFEIPKRPL